MKNKYRPVVFVFAGQRKCYQSFLFLREKEGKYRAKKKKMCQEKNYARKNKRVDRLHSDGKSNICLLFSKSGDDKRERERERAKSLLKKER